MPVALQRLWALSIRSAIYRKFLVNCSQPHRKPVRPFVNATNQDTPRLLAYLNNEGGLHKQPRTLRPMTGAIAVLRAMTSIVP